jgi:hypothetical protein
VDALDSVSSWAAQIELMMPACAHLSAPHMDAYRSRTKDLVTGRTVHGLASVDKEVPTPVG